SSTEPATRERPEDRALSSRVAPHPIFAQRDGCAHEAQHPVLLLCREGARAETMSRVPRASPGEEQVRTAELIGALCLATDLGMGFPFEHGLHETLIAMRLADRLQVDRDTASATYYSSLLSHAGCTAEAHVAAEVFGGSMTEHFNPLMYGSVRQVFIGLLRSLPDDGVTG